MTIAELRRIALSFAVDARKITDIGVLTRQLLSLIAPIGMSFVASGVVSGPRAETLAPSHFSNWPPEWNARYVERGLILVDPAPRWARSSGRRFF